MGNTDSSFQPLSSREISKLTAEFPINADGINFYFKHYNSLLAGLNSEASISDNNPQDKFKRWLLEKCVDQLFHNLPPDVSPSFPEYLNQLMDWRRQKPKDRLECIYLFLTRFSLF